MAESSFGIPFLDKALMDGFPKGFTVLVSGPPGGGMEIFSKHFASAGEDGEQIIYFTTSETDEEIVQTMKDCGWEPNMKIVNIGRQYYEMVLARQLEVSSHRLEGIKLLDIRKRRIEDVKTQNTNFLTFLTYEISKLEPPFRIIIDSIDFFFEYYSTSDVLSAIRTIKAHTQHNKGVALLSMSRGVYDNKTESGMEEIVDVVIELERKREDISYNRNMVIRKVRNRPDKTGILPYNIGTNGVITDGEK